MSAIVRLLAVLLGLAIQTHGLAAVPPDFVVVDGAQRLHSVHAGTVSRIEPQPAWSASEAVYGRVVIRDAETGASRLAVVGIEAGDAFGLAACAIGDLDGDGVEDVAIAAPGAGLKTDASSSLRTSLPASMVASLYGRVCLVSGATGVSLGTLHGLPEEMSCWGVARVRDFDGDGRDDVLIRSFVLAGGDDPRASRARYTLVGTGSGIALDTGWESDLISSIGIVDINKFWNARPLRQIRRGVAADLNADGVVDGADLTEQIGNLGQTGDDMGRGDVDTDQAIDGADVAITIGSMGQSQAVNAPSPEPAQFNPCKSSTSSNCFLCPVDGTCDGTIGTNPPGGGDGGDGGGGGEDDEPPICIGCPGGPCAGCCPTCPCRECPPGGCPPPDVNCNGQPDPPECGAFYKLDLRTDSNNDNAIDEADDEKEDGGIGRVLVVPSELLDAPRDRATITIVKSPPSVERWRADFAGLTLIQAAGAQPIVSGAWYQGSPPGSFVVESELPGSSRFQVTVDTGTSCGRKSDSVDLFTVSPEFRLPTGSQNHQRFLAILPGDASKIAFDHGIPAAHKVFHYTVDRSDGRFVLSDETLGSSAPSASSIDSLQVLATAVGDGHLEVRRGGAQGPIVARKKLRIGGTIKITYDRVPTFKVSVSESGGGGMEPVQHPGGGTIGALPGVITMGGGPIYTNGRNMVRSALVDATNNVAQTPARFKVRIEDADEQPLGLRRVRFVPRDGMLKRVNTNGAIMVDAPNDPEDMGSNQAVMTGFSGTTGNDGTITFELIGDSDKVRAKPLANFPGLPWQEQGVAVERVGVLVGRGAHPDHLPSETLGAQYFTTAHLAFRHLAFSSGLGFTMDAAAKASGNETDKHLFHSFEVPLANHTQVTILKHWLEGPVINSTDVPGFLAVPLWLYDADGVLNPVPEFEFMGHVGLFHGLTAQERLGLFEAMIAQMPVPWLTPGVEPSTDQKTSVLAMLAAGGGEIAWGFVPFAPDLLDLGKEAFWQPLVNNDYDPDYWVMGFSTFGLLADAGYIVLPAGAAGNAAAAVGKFVARLEHRFPGLVRGIVRSTGTVAGAARQIADYAKRIPAPPGGDVMDHSILMVEVMMRQVVRVLTLPGMAVDKAVEALTFVWRRAGSAWGDDAIEGVALICKRCFPHAVAAGGGCDWLAERLLSVYGDDIARKTLEISRKLPLDDLSMTAEAVEGVAVALKARGGDMYRVRQFVESAAAVANPAWVGKTFANIKELDDVDGLARMVNDLGSKSHDADWLRGVMFEAEVAKRLKAGVDPASGSVLRIAADFTDESRKIDTITTHWAAQIKHTRIHVEFDVDDIRGSSVYGTAYLNEMVAQAGQQGLAPVLITNRPVTAALMQALEDRGILHRLMESPFE